MPHAPEQGWGIFSGVRTTMGGSITIWLIWAVLLFWAVGVYNRLVKLRAHIKTGFAQLQEQLLLYPALVHSSFVVIDDHGPAAQAGLVGAAEQYASCVQAAHHRPLEVDAMRALTTAHDILLASWSRLHNEPPDLAGELMPEALEQQWQKIDEHTQRVRAEFNARVNRYNQAIDEIPACWLASLFRFREAQTF